MENGSRCLDADVVLAFATGRLSADARAEALLHVDGCEPCRLVVAEIAKDASEPPPPDEPPESEVPDLVDGRFRVLERLGTGAMGTVYRARDEKQGVEVALKLLRPEADPARGAKAIARELAVGRRVTHPNVCRSFDAGAHGDSAYITMELIDGETLADVLSRGELSETRAIEVLRAIADGLAAVHAAGIVHRDLKPANVLLDRATHRPIVTDFGLAAEVESKQSRRLVGTPAYWAPEQARGEPATPASDVYSLGLLAYRLLARRDYSLSDRDALAAVPRAHRAFVAACLASRPADRPADAAEARALLNRRHFRGWLAVPAAASLALVWALVRPPPPAMAPPEPAPPATSSVAPAPPPPPPPAVVPEPPVVEKKSEPPATKPPVVHRRSVPTPSAAPPPPSSPPATPDPLFRH